MSLALALPLTLVSLTGLIFNCYILVVVLLTRQAASANNLLLLHLGTVDTLLGILFLSFSAPGLSKSGWLSVGAPCIIHGFLFTLLHPLVLWTICGLNCDRYYAIAAPLHYGHIVSPKKVLAGIGAGWIVSLALCLPPLFAVAPYTYSHELGACAPDFSLGPGALWYSTIYTAFTLLLPATLIICCNLKILMIARYHRHRIASAIYEVTLSAQVTITHQRNPFFVPTVTAPSSGGPKFRGKSAVSTVLQLLGSFLLLYLPYYTAILWESSLSILVSSNSFTKNHPNVLIFASILLTCSPSVNGFLYGIRNKTLRKTFQNYWRKKLTKSEVNQEIQARTPSTCGSRRPSLTPLGFFTKPSLQRRLSEALLDVQRAVGSPQRPKIKRIASELSWRPNSTNGLDLSPTMRMSQTTSCNTLQVPKEDEVSTITEEDIYVKLKQKCIEGKNRNLMRPSLSAANLLLQKVFGLEHSTKKANAIQTVLDTSPKHSPRIMITRAFSEDSDNKSPSIPGTPAKKINKKHSSSATTLLERKWRQLCFGDEDEIKRSKPLLLDNTSSNKSSDSSENSDASSGRLYMNLDNNNPHKDCGEDSDSNEDQLLLNWPAQKKYKVDDAHARNKRSSLLKQTLVQAEEVVL